MEKIQEFNVQNFLKSEEISVCYEHDIYSSENDHLWGEGLQWKGVGQKLLFSPDETHLVMCLGPAALPSCKSL